jgi:two-component system response regulator YesN
MYKVLIVEDEDIIRKGLIYAIDWPKVDCVVVGGASDGIEGLNKIRELRPDIVITDVRMPIKDGLWMLQESISEFGYEAIITSGYSEFEYAKKAVSLGVHEYLLKPINFEQLYEIINCLTRKIDMKKNVMDRLEAAENMEIYHRLLDFEYYDSNKGKTEYVPAIIEYIKENYSKKISLSDLSKKYYISNAYLNSKFKEATNYTFNDFFVNVFFAPDFFMNRLRPV